MWIIWEEMIQEMFNQHIILQCFHQWTIVPIKKNIVPQPNTLLSNEDKAFETSEKIGPIYAIIYACSKWHMFCEVHEND